MDKGEIAKQYFLKGYNCAQSVVLAFKDEVKMNEETLKALSLSFGGGISRLRNVCGCISGMGIIFGLLYGHFDVLDEKKKGEHYALIQKLSKKFEKEMGSMKCSFLLNIKDEPSNPYLCHRNQDYYQNRPCGKYIAYMANLMQEEMNKHGKD